MSETIGDHSNALRALDGNRITPLETEVRAQGARIADDAQYAKRRLEEHGAANVEIRKRLHDLEEAVRKFTDDPASLDERVAALEGKDVGGEVGTEGVWDAQEGRHAPLASAPPPKASPRWSGA